MLHILLPLQHKPGRTTISHAPTHLQAQEQALITTKQFWFFAEGHPLAHRNPNTRDAKKGTALPVLYFPQYKVSSSSVKEERGRKGSQELTAAHHRFEEVKVHRQRA